MKKKMIELIDYFGFLPKRTDPNGQIRTDINFL